MGFQIYEDSDKRLLRTQIGMDTRKHTCESVFQRSERKLRHMCSNLFTFTASSLEINFNTLDKASSTQLCVFIWMPPFTRTIQLFSNRIVYYVLDCAVYPIPQPGDLFGSTLNLMEPMPHACDLVTQKSATVHSQRPSSDSNQNRLCCVRYTRIIISLFG